MNAIILLIRLVLFYSLLPLFMLCLQISMLILDRPLKTAENYLLKAPHEKLLQRKRTSVSETIRKPPFVKAQLDLKKTK